MAGQFLPPSVLGHACCHSSNFCSIRSARYDRAGLRVDGIVNVLEDRLLVVDVFAALPIELPEDRRLADGEHELAIADVDQHALEDFIQVERFGRNVLVVPLERAVVGIEGDRRACVEHGIGEFQPTADRRPWLGLRNAPIREVQLGIIAAGNPRFTAAAQRVRQRAPGVTAGLSLSRHGVELPELPARLGVVGADEAAGVLLEPRAAAESLKDLSVDCDGAARIEESQCPIRDPRLPREPAVAGVDRHQLRVVGGKEDLVLIDRQAAQRRRGGNAEIVFPDEIARPRIEGLQHVSAVQEIHDAVVNDRGRLIPSRSPALVHRPDPLHPQVVHVVPCDLVQRAVVPCVVGAAHDQPVAGIGIAEHRVGDRHVVLDLAVDRDARAGDRLAPSATSLRRGSASGRGCCAASACRRRGLLSRGEDDAQSHHGERDKQSDVRRSDHRHWGPPRRNQ